MPNYIVINDKETLVDALDKCMGNMSAAGRMLGVSWEAVKNAVARFECQSIIDGYRERMCDNAESSLGRAVINGESWAVQFTLRTLGRKRGYVERTEVSLDGVVRVGIAETMTDDQLARIALGSSEGAIGETEG
jgi:hypothetical protein